MVPEERGRLPAVFHSDGSRSRFSLHLEEGVRRAGVPDLKFHDLRRTAVRNMRRAGVPRLYA